MRKILLLCLLCGLPQANAVSFTNDEVQQELDTLKNSKELRASGLPPKKDNHGHLVSSQFKIADGDEKILSRRIFLHQAESFFSPPLKNDQAQVMMEDDQFVESIASMDQNLRSGRTKVQPWSDDYWPFYRGGTATRYADSKFPASPDWKENYNYISKNPFHLIFGRANENEIDVLSPAEKYDLLLESQDGVLTRSIWTEGENYYREYGKVESWMGICHGWAPAAYMSARPLHSVTVSSHNNQTKIRFYPDDIKALISLLWANARTPVRFVGGRCNEKNPRLDSLGRPVNPDCLDSNPATWHKVVVNRLGANYRSFILDVTWDYQVWNQPMISYSYRYFNPKTMKATESLQEATVNLSDFRDDKFKSVRAPEAKSVVGITMELTYAIERRPTHAERDDAKNDRTHTVIYSYDLEIDAQGNIVGGEWYRLLHPDFLWTPTKDSRALARNDVYLLGQPNWDGKSALSTEWKKHALEAAQQSQPLAKIIESLLELSQK